MLHISIEESIWLKLCKLQKRIAFQLAGLFARWKPDQELCWVKLKVKSWIIALRRHWKVVSPSLQSAPLITDIVRSQSTRKRTLDFTADAQQKTEREVPGLREQHPDPGTHPRPRQELQIIDHQATSTTLALDRLIWLMWPSDLCVERTEANIVFSLSRVPDVKCNLKKKKM